MDMTTVDTNIIPSANPPVRNSGLKTMFKRRLGALHTMENAMRIAPATSIVKSRKAQTPISFLETIVDVGFVLKACLNVSAKPRTLTESEEDRRNR